MRTLAFLWAVAFSAALLTLAAPAPLAAQEQDSPEVDQAYQQAMDAFAASDWATAAAGFDDVAQRTVNPGRRATATELAPQSRRREAEAAAQQPTQGEELGAPPPPVPEGYGATPEVPPPPPAVEAPTEEEADDARMSFIGGTTVFGLTLWGATPGVAFETDIKVAIGLYMIIGAGSFFVPFFLTQNTLVSPGAASLSISLGVGGMWVGALSFGLVTAFDISGDETRGLLGTMTLMSLAGVGAGYAWADLTDMDDGTAHAISTGMTFSTLWAFGLEWLILGENAFEDNTRVRLNMAGMLAGAGLGIVGGKVMADNRTWSWGDVEIVQTGGILGAYLAIVGLVLPSDLENAPEPRIWAPVIMAGSIGGLVLGDYLVDGVDVTNGQAFLVDLGAYVGGLFGAGLGYLVSGDDFSQGDAKVMLALSAATAFGGGALTFFVLDLAPEGAESDPSAVSVHLSPTFAEDSAGNLAPGFGLAGTF